MFKTLSLLFRLSLCFLNGVPWLQADNPDPLAPENAVQNLELYQGVGATLFASEPMISSVTNLDIDHRGRVWVCEVMNYREHGRKNTRPEGDRILILEDEDGDGKADTSKTYYQGRDVDAALGICVLGNQAIVTCAPNIILFTDEDGDDRPDKKEYLFTNSGEVQDDHSIHSVIYGPDGKLYWNMGNHGKFVHDKQGKLVIDQAGNPVIDRRYVDELPGFEAADTPYWGGMIFRCDPDGSQFETLAHNFRNNYEVAIDSFGGLWQSDNDDDGNFGCRLNYILEYGNYGYREENTGAFWKEPRVSEHPEIPKRHWHQNDPGVVPNFVQTGAGSPTAITVYEGNLLPEIFHDRVIHCDAGPGIVWAAIAKPDGAGFTGHMVNLLKEAKRGWVRPVDAATAPDGSLFITDWYDPVVSWNRQWDVPRGRIYRLAPKNHRYQAEPAALTSAAAAANAMKSPNSDTRYRARQALFEFERSQTIRALKRLYENSNPRFRARALWLLAELEGPEKPALQEALKDPDPDIRVTAVRAARQQVTDLQDYLEVLVEDPSARVRSEVAIALHNLGTSLVPDFWARLADQLDAEDRWYLEALGIAADGRWDACLDSWLSNGGGWTSPTGRKLIWRSRGSRTPDLLGRLLNIDSIPAEEIRRLIRAFDFQWKSPEKQEALRTLAYHRWSDHSDLGWLISSEAFQRLMEFEISTTAPFQKRLDAFLDAAPINETTLKLVARFGQSQQFPAILEGMIESHSGPLQLSALSALLDGGQHHLIAQSLNASSQETRRKLVQVLADSRDDRTVPLLREVLLDEAFSLELRKKATRALGLTRSGAVELVDLAKKQRFPEILKAEAGAALTQTLHVRAYEEAARFFPLPKMKGDTTIPGMTDLVVLQGNSQKGKAVFQAATCATCHQVNGEGVNFGPDLSAVGAKFPKTGLFEAILNPNASVSESYHTTTIKLKDGTESIGLLASETHTSIRLQLPGGQQRSFPKSAIAEIKKSEESLMPSGLQRLMTVNDLADLVEYLSSLK